MAAGKKQKLDFDLQGLRYFRQLKPLLERLASIGTERNKAPLWLQLSIQALIVYSIVTTCLETMPGLEHYREFFRMSEVVVVILFTIEYIGFWAISDRKGNYPFQPGSIIDLLAILPFYLGLGVDLRSLRALRLFRLFRVLRLSRYSKSLTTLGEAFSRCGPQLVTVGTIAGVIILLSAMALYYAEHDAQPDVYTSIPASLWWALVTLTTVGYGDVYPVTFVGRVIAAVIMLLGIGMIAIPSGLLSSTLTDMLREEAEERAKA